ncbi:MAG: hypothetical protein A3A33_02155 [Candidatus Yanofskybacteria bacterium RIFCSPLOWO2_01_FULL_49_25]|uniref:Uncharacterized protein n=1 Tax=Candidatus Yanofskybacteria bacterium RIFCSPLOWO2_01_FULL_49_25 TaxID=1802701 RepID=A0A1F8GRU8_9BACT|nr:MAG: hypothetical protein A3A33_02155 [Candidatus Yanofskybacteria bacterium RIFCSPLOWO2_01_FULL_49_25]
MDTNPSEVTQNISATQARRAPTFALVALLLLIVSIIYFKVLLLPTRPDYITNFFYRYAEFVIAFTIGIPLLAIIASIISLVRKERLRFLAVIALVLSILWPLRIFILLITR